MEYIATPMILLILNALMEGVAGLQGIFVPGKASKAMFPGYESGANSEPMTRAFGTAALSIAVLSALGALVSDNAAALMPVLGALIFYNVVIAGVFIWLSTKGIKNTVATVVHIVIAALLIYYWCKLGISF